MQITTSLAYNKPFGYWARYFIGSGSHPLGCVLLTGPWLDAQELEQRLSRPLRLRLV